MLSRAELQKYIRIGEKNREVIRLLENWCAHAQVVIDGGVGLLEQSTGLPIAMRRVTCEHERASGVSSMHVDANALDFHDRNCATCEHRLPVRLPNLSELLRRRADEDARIAAAQTSRAAAARAKTQAAPGGDTRPRPGPAARRVARLTIY